MNTMERGIKSLCDLMCLNLFASHGKEKKYCFLIIFQSIKFDNGVFSPIKGNLMEASSYIILNG